MMEHVEVWIEDELVGEGLVPVGSLWVSAARGDR
jgi:hypothetical protein